MQRGRLTVGQFETLLMLAADTARHPLAWDPREAFGGSAAACDEQLGLDCESIGLLIADPERLNERIAERFRAEAMDRLCSIAASSTTADELFLDAAEAVNREAAAYAAQPAFPEGMPTPRQKGAALMMLRYGATWEPDALWSKVCEGVTVAKPRRLSEVLRDAGLALGEDRVTRGTDPGAGPTQDRGG